MRLFSGARERLLRLWALHHHNRALDWLLTLDKPSPQSEGTCRERLTFNNRKRYPIDLNSCSRTFSEINGEMHRKLVDQDLYLRLLSSTSGPCSMLPGCRSSPACPGKCKTRKIL